MSTPVTTAASRLEEQPAAPVLVTRHGHVLVITLNRPQAKNAVNADVSRGIGGALELLQADPELRVGIVTGAGDAFCAGADLKELGAGRRVEDPDHLEWGFGGIVRHFIDKPLVAAVNGLALGGGTEIAMACDLVLAEERATFGLPEVKRGLLAAGGGALRLPRHVPAKLAAELLYTGDTISAAHAARMAIINDVVPDGTVVARAMELASRIADNAPLAVQATKRVVHDPSALTLTDWDPEAWKTTYREMRALLKSEDGREGPRAFAEKRKPRWQAR